MNRIWTRGDRNKTTDDCPPCGCCVPEGKGCFAARGLVAGVLAVAVLVFGAMLVSLAIPSTGYPQTLNKAVERQLDRDPSGAVPCFVLRGGDPVTVLGGELRTICTRGQPPGGAGPASSTGGGAATPAALPSIVQQRLRETRREEKKPETEPKTSGTSADRVVKLGSGLSFFISGEFENLNRNVTTLRSNSRSRMALVSVQPNPWVPQALGIQVASSDPTNAVLAFSESAGGPLRVTGIEIQEATANSAIIRIQADQAVVDYNTFMLSDPPRIVIDIAGALMAESMSRKEAGKGSVKQIRASQYRPEPNPVVRVVLDLASILPYQVVGRPEIFRILIGEAVAKVDQVQAPEIARGPLRVRGVEIQEATATSAIIRIQADQPVASHKTFLLDNPPRLVIDISGALMAESMSRKEAGKGPIKQIRASQYRREPDPVVRVVLDLTSTLPYQVTGIPETFRILVGEAVSKARKVPPPVPPTVTAEQPKFAQEEVTKAPEAEEPWGRNVGVWGLGEYESLNRDVTTFEDGYDSDIWRLTTGVDYQFTEQIVAGLAFDYYNHNGDFDNGGDFNNNSYGFLAFGSFRPFEQAFLQVTAGYARKAYDRDRVAKYEEPDGTTGAVFFSRAGDADSDFNADEARVGALVGYDFPIRTATISPRAGFDFFHIDFETYSEEGSTGLELTFHDDDQTWLQTRVGAQASMALRTGFGVIMPQASFDWMHELENDQREVIVSFVDDTRAKRFTYQTEKPDRDWFEINAGVVALVLPDRVQAFGNYRTLVGHRFFDSHAVTIGFRATF